MTRTWRPTWTHIYLLLASMNLLTVGLGSALSRQVMNMQSALVESSSRLSDMRAAAAAANAPGNEVFDSLDPLGEEARLAAAAAQYARAAAYARTDPRVSGKSVVVARLNLHSTNMIAEGNAILTLVRDGRRNEAARLMSQMDRSYSQFNQAMNELEASLRLDALAQIAGKQRLEAGLGGLALLMVFGAVLYGRRLTRELRALDLIRQAAMAEMQHASRSALESARLKSEFLSNMSHEIRTPMNGVIGMTSLLLDTPLNEDQRDMAQTIRRSGDALLTIVNDVLDFSKIEAGKLDLESVDFDLQETLDEVLELFGDTVRKKGLELVAAIDPAIETRYRGDPGRLRQVLTNLIGNAVKFADCGEVIVQVMAHGSTPHGFRVEVRDTGIGLSEAARGRLFQPFTQADGSTTRRFGGTGLGLAISKRLVELMHGAIGVDSVEGIGSTFWFTVELAAADLTLVAAPQFSGLRVLVVDDHVVNLQVLERHLTKAGMEATCLEDPRQVEACLLAAVDASRAFDLVILDQMMPHLDGLALVRQIRREPRLAALPVAIFSSSDTVTFESAREAGAQACLLKPVRQALVLRTVANLTRQTAAPGTAAAAPVSLGLCVLVAEDNLVNQVVARRMLQKLGCEVVVVADGLEAIAALSTRRFDLVLMDCQMPNLDGYGATRQWRETEEATGGQRIPIVALTASAMAIDRQDCLNAGMDDHLSKPVKASELQRACERWTPARAAPRVA